MKLNVFVCRDGFLLSPDCMVLPKMAQEVFWPVTSIIGVLDCDDLPTDLCERVNADVEDRQFSFVATGIAIQARIPTLAAAHPFDDSTQLHPGHV